ncbi:MULTISPECIES: hypothetical protein [unclassified Duganella]|uniref:hypothetical protein n=1 Tax=unclassified Duganella TaxID=2636909 RepID=UPI00088597F0|nr:MULTISPECIES: hypothetical protein [unclassified Duganella]SDH41056.1 hypothetical protein SAMN05216320_1139 [Duganella sp. OV458]SDK61138.1 hypothetical protein SAMN05428973_113154 [Duganella sp. OV510]
MTTYRKKPIEVEAITYSELLALGGKKAEFVYGGCQVLREKSVDPDRPAFIMLTPTGNRTANPGDMVITGVDGDVYGISVAAFEATHEPT